MKKRELLDRLRWQATGIMEDNRFCLVLKQNPETGKTEICPFCGKRHVHGRGGGYRMPHCEWDICRKRVDSSLTFENARGETFRFSEGYFLSS